MEKSGMHHLELERTISEGSSRENDARIDALTPEEQKKVLWRIDVRLVLTLGFMYCKYSPRAHSNESSLTCYPQAYPSWTARTWVSQPWPV